MQVHDREYDARGLDSPLPTLRTWTGNPPVGHSAFAPELTFFAMKG